LGFQFSAKSDFVPVCFFGLSKQSLNPVLHSHSPNLPPTNSPTKMITQRFEEHQRGSFSKFWQVHELIGYYVKIQSYPGGLSKI
jgi:hypothetical protein